jgi:5-methylcytosine-specific restriction protein A
MAGRLPQLNKAFPVTVDAQGRKLCRWDQGVIPQGRRTFCKQGCVHQVSMRTNPDYLRRLVYKRDRGICAECGRDTEKITRVMGYARKSLAEILGEGSWGNWYWFQAVAAKTLKTVGWYYGQHQWEADHIVEVVRGGDSCLDNMQTLCLLCHKAKTKHLAVERAQERRDAKRQLLPQTQSTPSVSAASHE